METLSPKKIAARTAMLLKAMASGIPVEIGGIRYGMTADLDVGIIYGENMISHLSHMEIGRFMRMVRDISENEWIVLAGNITLSSLPERIDYASD